MGAVGGIPVKPSRPEIELVSVKVYSTGANGKVYSEKVYKAFSHNFGVEFSIRNNTISRQAIKMVGYVYDDDGTPIVKWKPKRLMIDSHSLLKEDFYVERQTFTGLRPGIYKIQFWANDKRIFKKFVYVTKVPK